MLIYGILKVIKKEGCRWAWCASIATCYRIWNSIHTTRDSGDVGCAFKCIFATVYLPHIHGMHVSHLLCSSSRWMLRRKTTANRQLSTTTSSSSSLIDYLEISVITRLQLFGTPTITMFNGLSSMALAPACVNLSVCSNIFCSTDFIANGNKLPVFSLPTPACPCWMSSHCRPSSQSTNRQSDPSFFRVSSALVVPELSLIFPAHICSMGDWTVSHFQQSKTQQDNSGGDRMSHVFSLKQNVANKNERRNDF